MSSSRNVFRKCGIVVGIAALTSMGFLSACSTKTDQTPTSTTPSSPTEKSMSPEGPNSFSPTVIGTSPTIGANDSNGVQGPIPPPPGAGPGAVPGVGAGPAGGAPGEHTGRH